MKLTMREINKYNGFYEHRKIKSLRILPLVLKRILYIVLDFSGLSACGPEKYA